MTDQRLTQAVQDAVYFRACYVAGVAVAATVCQLDFDGAELSNDYESRHGGCNWRPSKSGTSTERELLIMALAGHIGTKTGRGKRVHRPNGTDYIFRSSQDLRRLTELMDKMYDRECHRVGGAPPPNRQTFMSARFEEAWSDASWILTTQACMEATHVIARGLTEKGRLSKEEVEAIVADATH